MLELETHRFYGTDADFVVIIGGLHTSEQGGIEVARWIIAKLAARDKATRLGAIVIPEIFPARAKAARTAEFPKNEIADWREDLPSTRKLYPARTVVAAKDQTIFPARQFPPPGKPLAFLSKGILRDDAGTDIVIDGHKVPLQPEIEYLLRVIEAVKPVRIVSIHGKRRRTKEDLKTAVKHGIIDMSKADIDKWAGDAVNGVNFAGTFVDPRYALDPALVRKGGVELCKFDPDLDPAFPLQGDKTKKRFDSARTDKGRADDAVCLALSKAVGDKSLVPGNHVDDPIPVVHYAKEGGTPDAFSLGDWGPVDVEPGKNTPGSRAGAPVYTIEVDQNYESWAFFDAVQVAAEDGSPVAPPATPSERASKKKVKAVANPSFDAARSKALQAYAKAIIDTVLQLP